MLAPKDEAWDNTFFGSINTQYNFSEVHTKTGGVVSNMTAQNGMYEFVDGTDTLRKGSQQYTARFSGSDQTPVGMGHAQANVSEISVEYQDTNQGMTAKLGRQGATSGGVLGFFDGVSMTQKINDAVSANVVTGMPVDSSHTGFDVNREFVGVSSDIAAFDKKWNFNVYGIEQVSRWYNDRQAVGGTARTGSADYSFYTAAEYDVYLSALNFVTLNGSYNLPDYHSSFYGTLDYRRTPLAMVSNALIGQPDVSGLPKLYKLYSAETISQWALDRTTMTETASLGARYEFNPNFQITPNMSVTNTGSMPSSGGIPASPSLGNQYSYGLSVINSNVMMENDNIVTSGNYGVYTYGDSYTMNLSDSFPVQDDLNMGAGLNGNYMTSHIAQTAFVTGTPRNYRIGYGPSLRADYRYSNSLSFNISNSINWTHDYSSVTPVHTLDQSFQFGMRYSF